jgi:HSP20 family molecular chaperone IbpA
MLSTWRDPMRSVFEDLTSDVFDPFSTSFGTDLLPGWNRGGNMRRSNLPRLINVDAFEADNEFRVVAEAPGVHKDKIDVSVENGVLVIRAQKQNPYAIPSVCLHCLI